jgi:branched-chain amino acid transport system ATP-binding protein
MTGGPLLEVVDLQAGYGAATVLHGVSLSVRVGSVTALLGGNGAGKSTLMRAVAGILKARGGRVLFKGRDIGAEPAHWRVSAGIALVPEGRLVFPTMTVEENLRLGAISPRARDGRGMAAGYGSRRSFDNSRGCMSAADSLPRPYREASSRCSHSGEA